MRCSKCNREMTDESTFCPFCGEQIRGASCPRCHMVNPIGAQFCSRCGISIVPKKRWERMIWNGAHLGDIEAWFLEYGRMVSVESFSIRLYYNDVANEWLAERAELRYYPGTDDIRHGIWWCAANDYTSFLGLSFHSGLARIQEEEQRVRKDTPAMQTNFSFGRGCPYPGGRGMKAYIQGFLFHIPMYNPDGTPYRPPVAQAAPPKSRESLSNLKRFGKYILIATVVFVLLLSATFFLRWMMLRA